MKATLFARLLLVACGLAVFTPPLWHGFPLIAVATVVVGFAITHSRPIVFRWGWCLTGFAIAGLVLGGLISSSVATLFLAASLLVVFFSQTLPAVLCVLLFATPLFQALALISADALSTVFAPASAPALAGMVMCVVLGQPRLIIGVTIPSVFVLAWIGNLLGWDPVSISLACAVPPSLSLATFAAQLVSFPGKRFAAIALFVLAHIGYMASISNPLRQDLYVWLPEADETYEAQFFKNYAATLRVVGLKVTQVNLASAVPEYAIVLCPWATEPAIAEFLDGIRKLPYASSVTVIIAGEHTNYRGFADLLNPGLRRIQFNNDTTVPPGNRDFMGALWTGSLVQFPPEAAINRGASLRLTSMLGVPLLTAQSIFSDPGPAEIDPLWVGDYRQMSEDRRGWHLLAAAFRDGPLWTLVGDNSFLLNHLVAASPEPLLRLLALASLWPSILMEGFLLLMAMLLLLVAHRSRDTSGTDCEGASAVINITALFGFYAVFIVLSFFVNAAYRTSETYESLRPPWGGFDERSHAKAIVELASDLEGGVEIFTGNDGYIREKQIGRTGRSEIHIGHVAQDFAYKSVRVTNCGRLGAISLPGTSVQLMDAQFCTVHGDVRILLGTREQALAFVIEGSSRTYFILDQYFLSGAPPRAGNLEFVRALLLQEKGA